MQSKRQMVLWGILFIISFTLSLSAGSDGYAIVNGPKDFYYGHVSNVDAQEGPEPYILRENGARRVPATLNMPLIPGDIVVTPGAGRLELQFDNGTIIRMDAETELKIETILAESLTTSNKMTNLILSRGRVYAMFKEYSSREICQFLLPTAAVRLRHQTVAILGVGAAQSSDVWVRRGKADILYGPDAAALKKHDVLTGEHITIGPDHRYAFQPFSERMPFESWNNSLNDNFENLHKGQSMLPKPVRRWPLAVQYFAEKYSNLFGEWIYDDYLGYIWRPADNDRPYAGGWRPYYSGQWEQAGNQLYWVPSEPWGWIPFHLGVWHWDNKRGWLWVPGSVFAPAWVDWSFKDNFFAWRPYGFWDWLPGGNYWLTGGHGYVPDTDIFASRRFTGKVSKDQLAQPSRPAYEMPREFKGIIKALQSGLDKHDPALLASLRMQRESGVAVPWDRLGVPRIQEHAVPLNTVQVGDKSGRGFSPVTPTDVARRTNNIFRTQNATVIAAPRPTSPAPVSPVSPPSLSDPAPRIFDWNPDARLASRYGLSIKYDSQSNLVYSPELRMRSGDRWLGGGMDGLSLREFIESGDFGRSVAGAASTHSNTSQAGDRSGGGSSGGGAEKK
ncbi:MAG: DUF6600 domain-containing protein [Candidatus Aminicenantales bacterium]